MIRRTDLQAIKSELYGERGARGLVQFLKAMPPETRERCLDLLDDSQAELLQDLFVLSELGFRRDGYFVEFGATDGVFCSNTYLLEKRFGWHGILAEPARTWHPALAENRRAIVDTRCVWSASGARLLFNETPVPSLSTLDAFSAADIHEVARREGTRYEVETVSLMDLLAEHGAPSHIDYLSVDTEGSELEILRSIDFSRYSFGIITCEHNHTDDREPIFELLTRNGYTRKDPSMSGVDDWYVGPAAG